MPLIQLTTFIAAPIEVVFDLSRSIDIHKHSMISFKEKAIAGKTSGLIDLGETVTWQATHLGKRWKMTVKITDFQKPYRFIDEQLNGPFKIIKHEHRFRLDKEVTVMEDHFHFESPYGILGKWVDKMGLTYYMKSLLEKRNRILQNVAESNQWQQFIS